MCKQKQFWSKKTTNENIDLYTAYYLRVNSRFQFQVTHSKLCAILATDEINYEINLKSYSVLTYRDCCPEFATGLKSFNRHSSKSI